MDSDLVEIRIEKLQVLRKMFSRVGRRMLVAALCVCLCGISVRHPV